MTDGHTIHSPVEKMLQQAGIKPKSFQSSMSGVVVLQAHVFSHGFIIMVREY